MKLCEPKPSERSRWSYREETFKKTKPVTYIDYLKKSGYNENYIKSSIERYTSETEKEDRIRYVE